MKSFESFDGALLIDKPAGPTSHDMVDFIRRHFGIKKVGHCGTLDPGATGLLIMLLGKATRLSEKLMSDDKVYEGIMKLGTTTNTYDADGEVVKTKPVPELTLEELNQEAKAFIGDQMQQPPMVSAIKKDGVPLYKLARQGVEVERKSRLIHIYRFHFSTLEGGEGRFSAACTKGTYIRSLVHDLGQQIGCGAHLKNLRRTKSGEFHVKDAVELEDLIPMTTSELGAHIIPFLKLAA